MVNRMEKESVRNSAKIRQHLHESLTLKYSTELLNYTGTGLKTQEPHVFRCAQQLSSQRDRLRRSKGRVQGYCNLGYCHLTQYCRHSPRQFNRVIRGTALRGWLFHGGRCGGVVLQGPIGARLIGKPITCGPYYRY